jgi:hypothetical protein
VPALVASTCAAILPIVAPALLAWWFARAARREIAGSDGQLGGRGFAIVAYVLSGYSLFATVALAVSALS